MDISIEEVQKEQKQKKYVIGTYISEDAYTELKKQADIDFMSISNLVRKIIYTYLSSSEKD